ncbi:hypothetical protein EMPG_13111 [Blastomyces silverae]|uniref:Uncharacterized protein n=1 Tax=Blastomyces silverae TaxID=2060906 RepID=A0A0H1BJJ9_9EURO|nr:hypothetical protein EMPG_13111 [Blastomyces silverae]
MSDDEDYYDDDFDADWFWFDEGERELADDLAEGTMHSPVYMDQAAYDAIDSASDWDYYTDEYFDDDQSVLHEHSLKSAATSPTGTRGRKQKKKKMKNKKRDGNDDNFNEQEEEDTPDSFCRILWRPSGYLVDQGELYEPGHGEKVALLKNWREIFKDSQPKRDHRLQKSASSSSSPSSSPSRVSPQSSTFSKSAAVRKQPGRLRKTEKRNLGARIGGIVNAPTFDREGNSEGGLEFAGDGDGGEDDGDDGGYKTPPPSFLSASQQDIYEKSRKKTTTGPSRSTNNTNDKGHNRRTGSHLKSVMSASAQEDIPELAPVMVTPSSPAASSKQQRSGRLSTAPSTITTAATTTTTATQATTSILHNGKDAMEPGTLLQDSYAEAADIADDIPLAGVGSSPRTHHRQGRKRKASSPPDSADGDQQGGKTRSKRVATRRKLGNDNDDEDDDDGGDNGKSKKEARIPTTRTRRSLREKKKR